MIEHTIYWDACGEMIDVKQETRYLGSIRESNIKYAWARCYFWWKIETKLAGLLFPAADKAKIVDAISERVPFWLFLHCKQKKSS